MNMMICHSKDIYLPGAMEGLVEIGSIANLIGYYVMRNGCNYFLIKKLSLWILEYQIIVLDYLLLRNILILDLILSNFIDFGCLTMIFLSYFIRHGLLNFKVTPHEDFLFDTKRGEDNIKRVK